MQTPRLPSSTECTTRESRTISLCLALKTRPNLTKFMVNQPLLKSVMKLNRRSLMSQRMRMKERMLHQGKILMLRILMMHLRLFFKDISLKWWQERRMLNMPVGRMELRICLLFLTSLIIFLTKISVNWLSKTSQSHQKKKKHSKQQTKSLKSTLLNFSRYLTTSPQNQVT